MTTTQTIPVITDFIRFVKNIPHANTISYLHDELGKRGVRVVYEKEDNFNEHSPAYKRIIFGTFRRASPFQFPGVIVSPDSLNDGTYKVISVPPAPPITNYQIKQMISEVIKTNKKPLTVVKAKDGTTLTLYYFRDEWRISTHRGIDVSNINATSSMTYKQLLDDVLEEYKEFSYDSLDTNKSYTIGFSHSEFHPFRTTVDPTRQPSVEAWFIQSADINKFNEGKKFINYEEKIGLPFQETFEIENIHNLFTMADTAYEKFISNGEVNYGYLLRSKHRYYFIESSLLKNIRLLFYSNKFNKLDSSFDKRKYIIVNAFLSSDKYEIFLKLFPRYKKEFEYLTKSVRKIIGLIVNIAQTPNFLPKTIYATTINEFYRTIMQTITLSRMKPKDIRGIAYTMIYDSKNTNMVYQLTYGDAKQLE